jgi:putative endonuclease
MNLWTRVRAWFGERRQAGSFGEQGEAVAAKYLRRLGYKIVARNERGRLGEIDIVAVDRAAVVFVEVKTRRSHEAGQPSEAITADKQRRLTRTALADLKRFDLLESPARFDVMAVTWAEGERRPVIEHYKNAFEPVGEGQLYS